MASMNGDAGGANLYLVHVLLVLALSVTKAVKPSIPLALSTCISFALFVF